MDHFGHDTKLYFPGMCRTKILFPGMAVAAYLRAARNNKTPLNCVDVDVLYPSETGLDEQDSLLARALRRYGDLRPIGCARSSDSTANALADIILLLLAEPEVLIHMNAASRLQCRHFGFEVPPMVISK